MASHLFETLDDPLGTIEDLFVSLIMIVVNLDLVYICSTTSIIAITIMLEHNTSVYLHYLTGYGWSQ